MKFKILQQVITLEFFVVKTDTLIGPPNHHSYAKALDDWHRKYFDNYSLEKSKSFLEFVKNDEIIEAWKVRFSHTDRFRLKDNSNDELISRSKAKKEIHFRGKKRRTKKSYYSFNKLIRMQ